MSVPMTLSDLERRDERGQTFQEDLINNARTVSPRTTKFGMITRMGRGVFLGGQLRPYRKGAGPQHFPVLGVPFCLCVHCLLQNCQI